MKRLVDELKPRHAIACVGDPERMFPVDESGPGQVPTAGERAALMVCGACPVRSACRAAVLDMPLAYGVAGGLTAAQRREVRAARLDRRARAA